jgi:Putative peptidoglycan binding domain/D-alanyl-D-alanine carboxypeptidase
MAVTIGHLQRGSTGPSVSALQQRLNELGANPPLEVVGIFGPKTEAAVKAFQAAHGLEADGVVGPLTRQALGLADPEPVTDGNLTELVAIPADINPGFTFCRQSTILNALGKPGALTADCTEVTGQRVLNLLVQNEDVGPFKVSGIRPAIEVLKRVFAEVQQHEPALFAALGTAGMLCCRRVRTTDGSISPNFSNHSWGTAVDIKINGQLDPRNDGKALRGLLMLHPFFNKEGFFWGAGFGGSSEDSMHFEASDELVRDWQQQGLLQ